ncbi:MAG: PAS domain S-box protein [Acidobacteria bacterium]|nr:PAS domain S-box protein [Acidobacteriota bacterium]
MRRAEKAIEAMGGTPAAFGAIVLALVVTLVTWPLFARTPFAPLFVGLMVAAQWADEISGLVAIPIAAAAHFVIFERMLPVDFGAGPFLIFVVLAFGMNRLIASRRRTEAAQRASEAQLRSGWDHAAMGAAILDLQGHVIRINPALARMFGHREPERSGEHYRELMRPTDDGEENALFLDLVQGRRDEYRREQAYHTKDGTVIWARAVMSLVRDDNGKPTGALLMLEDVTDRKALEEQVRQIQKLDAMGRLVAGVAHDFNNLLTAIGGYAELAREEVSESGPRRQLDEVLAVTRRATALTRQLLIFSRRPSIDPTPLNIDTVIAGMASLVERLAGKGVSVVTSLRAEASVKLDASHLEQIVVNLVVNARDAMPNGGTLTIETSLVELPGADLATKVPQPPSGPFVLLAVTDTGVGMDEQVKARLFEPFFTTKEPGEGTGLGLATVYGIVKQSAAYIWVESERGRGSRFRIYFPQVPPAVEAVSSPVISTLSPPLEPATEPSRDTGILVVEDDRSVRAFTCAVLRNAGYEALGASTGEEAMALASTHSVPLHLIVTDVALPGISGVDLVRQLRTMRPQARVLYSSGFSALTLKSQGVIEETGGFLAKPFTRRQLLAAVRARLEDRDIGASLR